MKTVAGVVTLVGLLLGLVLTAQARTTLSGFVDTSFFYEDLDDTNTFSLDEVELDIISKLTPWAGLRADINFRNADSSDEEVTAGGVTFSVGDDLSADDIMEQGYITLGIPLPFETTFQFGKFNAPIGWELLDPVDMYQFSHALVFDFGIPTNLTGALLALVFSPMVDLQLYVVNGWDELNDNNDAKTFGGRLGLTPMRGVNFGVSVISGAEQDDSNDNYRTVVDTDFTLELIERLLIGGEFNYGMEENVPGIGDAEWVGGLVTLHYDFTDIIGGTFRFDIFHDDDGARLPNDNPNVSSQTRYALTFAPTFALAPGVGALVEFRYDKSDEDVFGKDNGNLVDDVFTAAVEFTFSWEETFQLIAKK